MRDAIIEDIKKEKEKYVLLDWGGNVEEEKLMSANEAKKENEILWKQEPRLLRWALKMERIKIV